MVSNRNLRNCRGPLFSGDTLVSGRVAPYIKQPTLRMMDQKPIRIRRNRIRHQHPAIRRLRKSQWMWRKHRSLHLRFHRKQRCLDVFNSTLQGIFRIPPWEVRKIIDSKCHFGGICIRSLEGKFIYK